MGCRGRGVVGDRVERGGGSGRGDGEGWGTVGGCWVQERGKEGVWWDGAFVLEG